MAFQSRGHKGARPRTKKTQGGRVGCGCLLVLLVGCLVALGALVHPISLKILAGRLSYGDKIVPADIIFVPRFSEDKNGEVYGEAFRAYWSGEGKSILIEDDKVFGFTLKDIVTRMATQRGIKEGVIRAIELEGGDAMKAARVKDVLRKQGVKRVVLVVPAYGSRRFHSLYEAGESTGKDLPLFLIKAAEVSYFKRDEWWKSGLSRSLVEKEVYGLGSLFFTRFVRGTGGTSDGG